METKGRIEVKTDSPVVKKKTVRKVDLGAAAVYAQVQKDNNKDSLFAKNEQVTSKTAQDTQSAPNELVDLFSPGENRPVASIPPFHSNSGGGVDGSFGSFELAPGSKQQSDSNFADFSSFSQAQPSSPNDDFTEFQSSAKTQQPLKQNGSSDLFNDMTSSSSSSNQELLSQPTMNTPMMQPMQTMAMVSSF